MFGVESIRIFFTSNDNDVYEHDTRKTRKYQLKEGTGQDSLPPSFSLLLSPFLPFSSLLLTFLFTLSGEREKERGREYDEKAARRVRSRLCKFMQGPLNERKTRRQLRDLRALNYPELSATR